MSKAVETHPLISIRSAATVQEAAKLMADCSIGALGVLGPLREFAGIVTERDLSWFLAEGRDPTSVKVGDIANAWPVVMEGPIDESDALQRMSQARVRHLLVLEEGDLRIVSMRDFVSRTSERLVEPTARDVMTSPAVACRAEAFFEEVADILADRDISGMPVVDAEGSVIGVISERDLAYALGGPMVRLALRRRNERPLHGVTDLPRGARRAKEIMTTPPLTTSSSAPLEEVARLMRVHQVNRIPVVDAARLVGVVTRGDVLGRVAHMDHATIDLTDTPVLVGGTEWMPRHISGN